MTLSPLDIKNKTFSTKMRGFSPDEVDDFLDQVIDDYEASIRKNRELEKSLKHAEEKLVYFDELKDALNKSIVVAQDTADKMLEGARQQADLIVSKATKEANEKIEEANRQSSEIIHNTASQARSLAVETNDLKKKTRVFHQRLLLLLESQLESVKSEDWDEILRPFSDYVDDQYVTFKEVVKDDVNFDSEVPVTEELVETNDFGETQKVDVIFPIEEDNE